MWTSPQNVQKIVRFRGGEKRAESCHVSGCHGCFGTECRLAAKGVRQREVRQEKEHKLKLLGPDIFLWGGDLPREGVGAKNFGMSLEGGARKV